MIGLYSGPPKTVLTKTPACAFGALGLLAMRCFKVKGGTLYSVSGFCSIRFRCIAPKGANTKPDVTLQQELERL